MQELILDQVNWEKVKEIFAPEKETFLERAKNKLDKYPLVETTLMIAAGFGVVSLAVLMPGLVAVVGKEIRQAERDKFRLRLARLNKRKFIEIVDGPEGPVVKITEDGIKKALQYKLNTIAVKKPLRWDGLWRLVIFDVPEQKRAARDSFRSYLQKMGFYMLNKSVFVHPYPCFDEVEYLRQINGTGKEVTYITAKSIESSADLNLKSYFNLD